MESGQTVAGKYRLNQLLGSGGMADVWSATNIFTERQFAVKFMHPSVSKTPEASTRFLKEAKVSARINHPNIIDILDVGQTDEGTLFLVMELLTGFPLEVALKRQTPPMTLYDFARVMRDVAEGLAAAHRSGVIHRDLKPTNIFLHTVRDGVLIAKILDFGVSKFLEDDVNHALTVAGTVLGSPLYMSPEQARGDATVDHRTDIFSFGALLFEALCGYRPFEAKNFNALIVKIATSRPKSIDECASQLPECLRRVVRACLEPDLSRRAKSFEEVSALLGAAVPELEGSDERLPVPSALSSPADPEATNALPVVRTSDRPPGSSSAPPSGIHHSSASWATPHTSYASITASTKVPSPPSIYAIGGVALGIVAVAAGLGVALSHSRGPVALPASPQTSALGAHAPPPRVTSAPMPSAQGTDSVQIDALPLASSKHAAPAKTGRGKLIVSAEGGSCVVHVDGSARGSTPTAPIELSPGEHLLRCEASKGSAKTSTVTVLDGATSRFAFKLD